MGVVSTNKIREEQEDRLDYFPADRIPFYRSENAANDDKEVFKFYEKYGKSVIAWCCSRIEENNFLWKGSISKALFVKTAKSLGYYPEEET